MLAVIIQAQLTSLMYPLVIPGYRDGENCSPMPLNTVVNALRELLFIYYAVMYYYIWSQCANMM